MKLYLASGSPRRQQMLRDLKIEFEVAVPKIIEKRLRGEPVEHYVKRLAQEKAAFVETIRRAEKDSKVSQDDWCALAADTVVVYDRNLFEKPKNASDAEKMLRRLSGKIHHVLTGYCWKGCISGRSRDLVSIVKTKVKFAKKSDEFWRWYVDTGEGLDKSGAYAAQGIGISFIENISGSYANVVGLPVAQVIASFEKCFGQSFDECFERNSK